jgi:hypothetical protein
MPAIDLTRREDVELARTGTWGLSTGVWRAAPEDFAAAVAALRCPAVRRPYVRVGHQDSRFAASDGDPAIGWIENLRVDAGGNVLVGDYVGIPTWLDGVLASAYPDRSIEGAYNRRCALNHVHPFVLDGVALLGVTRPGVGTLKPIGGLDDVRALFDSVPVAASVGEVRIAASIPGTAVAAADGPGSDHALRNYWVRGEGAAKIRWGSDSDFKRCVKELREHVRDPEGLCAEYHKSATGMWPGDRRNRRKVNAADDGGAMPNPQPSVADRVREAWNSSGAPFSQHVHVVRAGEAIVLDEADRTFYRVPVTVGETTVTFGELSRVMPDFVDYDEDRVAASVVFASREESRPAVADLETTQPIEPPPVEPPPTTEPQEPQTPPDEGGVSHSPNSPGAEPEQVTPETTKEDPVSLSDDMRSRLGLADDADEAAALAAIDALKTKADTVSEPPAELVAASAAAVAERDELQKEVSVLASQMQQVTTELAAVKAKEAATVKASVLDEAQQQGKFPPSQRDQWATDYDAAPAAVTRILASIAPGTAVPVAASGYTGTGDEATDTKFDTDYDRYFRTTEKAGAN